MPDALSDSVPLAVIALVAAAAAVSITFARLLRGARLPGGAASAAILAGLVAGVLLGPGVLGNVLPDVYGGVTLGGRTEQRAYEARLFEARGAIAALEASGVTGVAIDEHERTALAELEPLRQAVETARIERRGVWDLTLALGAIAMIALLPLAGSRADSGELPFAARRAAFLAGAASFLLAGSAAYAGISLFAPSLGSDAALLFAAACATGWFAPPLDRVARDRPRHRAAREGFVSGLLAFGAACAVSLWLLPDRRAWLVAWAFIGALTVWAMAKAILRARRTRRVAHTLVLAALAPTVVALAASRIDPLPLMREPAFWIALVIAVIASTDGRWFGALLGGLAPGRAARPAGAAAAHATSGAGLVQAALLAVLASGGPIGEPLLAAGLLGALVLEVGAGAFRMAGAMLARRA